MSLKRFFFITFSIIFLSKNLFAQSLSKKFSKLSSPEKCWVIFHPFKAKRAFKVSIEAKKVSDSIKQTNLLDQDGNGGQVDAFRHAYWMVTLKESIGKRSAKSLGKAHEKGNYKLYKKKKEEDGAVPDKASSEMDLYNNTVGLSIDYNPKIHSKNELITTIVNKIKSGELKILKKDNNGDYLNCQGELLLPKTYNGLWESEKCVIKSNNSL